VSVRCFFIHINLSFTILNKQLKLLPLGLGAGAGGLGLGLGLAKNRKKYGFKTS
jgi:hypothetical protein